MADEPAVNDLVAKYLDMTGRLDVLVNCAGVAASDISLGHSRYGVLYRLRESSTHHRPSDDVDGHLVSF